MKMMIFAKQYFGYASECAHMIHSFAHSYVRPHLCFALLLRQLVLFAAAFDGGQALGLLGACRVQALCAGGRADEDIK